MSGLAAPLRVFHDEDGKRDVLSGHMAEHIDRQINVLVAEAQARAASVLDQHKDLLAQIRDELLATKTIEPERVSAIVREVREKYAGEVAAAVTREPPTGRLAADTTPLDKPTPPAAKRAKPTTTEEK